VVATDIRAEEGERAIGPLGDNARFVAHDVTDPESWGQVVTIAEEAFGQVDGLVNNAAIIRKSSLEDESFEWMDRMYRVNLQGSWLGIKSVIPAMRRSGGGSIVNISSTAG